MKDELNRILALLDTVETAGADNLYNLVACMNSIEEARRTEKADGLSAAVTVLNSIPVAGKKSLVALWSAMERLRTCIDERNKSSGGEAHPPPNAPGEPLPDAPPPPTGKGRAGTDCWRSRMRCFSCRFPNLKRGRCEGVSGAIAKPPTVIKTGGMYAGFAFS